MGDLLFLVVAVQVAWRLGEARVRPAAHHDAVLLLGHRLDKRAALVGERFPGHSSGNGHHHVDHEIAVPLHRGVGVDL